MNLDLKCRHNEHTALQKFELKLTLPFPVSVNQYYRAILRGRICCSILSKKGREYKQSVANHVSDHQKKPTDQRVMCQIKLFPPDKRKRDIDNSLKSLLDSLTGIAWEDDSQIDCIAISREPVFKGGKVEIIIRGIG